MDTKEKQDKKIVSCAKCGNEGYKTEVNLFDGFGLYTPSYSVVIETCAEHQEENSLFIRRNFAKEHALELFQEIYDQLDRIADSIPHGLSYD